MALFRQKFQSKTVEWPTPLDVWEPLNKEFGFTLDVCCTASTTKCEKYFTKEDDGLSKEWSGVCWMNPPYGNQMIPWLKKAIIEAAKGVITVAIVPARTNTNWWHDLCVPNAEVRFLRGRPKFGDARFGLPQPLAVLIFRPDYAKHKRLSDGGRTGGSAISEAKANASRLNGKRGGRPRKT